MFDELLFPTDGSDCATAALGVGVDVANATEAALHVLSVVGIASLGVDVRADIQARELSESANEAVAEATASAEEAGVESVSGTVERGASVNREIRPYVGDHDVDLVVLGTHGRTGLDRHVLGNVAEKLVRISEDPVLTVREPADEA